MRLVQRAGAILLLVGLSFPSMAQEGDPAFRSKRTQPTTKPIVSSKPSGELKTVDDYKNAGKLTSLSGKKVTLTASTVGRYDEDKPASAKNPQISLEAGTQVQVIYYNRLQNRFTLKALTGQAAGQNLSTNSLQGTVSELHPSSPKIEQKKYTEAQFRQAAQRLHDNPTSPEAGAEVLIILDFAHTSPAVKAEIVPPVADVLKPRRDTKNCSRLAASYVSGQLLAQLKARKKAGFKEEGAREMFLVYAKMRAADPYYHNPAVDQLLAAEKAGKLSQALAAKGK